MQKDHLVGGDGCGVQAAEPVPSYRGYALLGIGAYIIFHSDPPDDPELVIRIADAVRANARPAEIWLIHASGGSQLVSQIAA